MGRVDDVMNVSGHRLSTTENRKCPGLTDKRRGGSCGGRAARMRSPARSHLLLRQSSSPGSSRATESRASNSAACRAQDRPPSPARARPMSHARSAEDPVRQDHASPAAGYRRRPAARRHHHPRRRQRRRDDPRRLACRIRRRLGEGGGKKGVASLKGKVERTTIPHPPASGRHRRIARPCNRRARTRRTRRPSC